jgi:hypothetical protein
MISARQKRIRETEHAMLPKGIELGWSILFDGTCREQVP